jgi:DNA-directed RNA polymerase
MDQASHEQQMADQGRQRERRKNHKYRERGIESQTPGSKKIIKHLTNTLAEKIKEWTEDALRSPGRRHKALMAIQGLEHRVVSVLALQTILDALSKHRGYTKTAAMIGRRLEDEVRYISFEKQHPHFFRAALDRSGDFSGYDSRRRHILRAMSIHGLEVPSWSEDTRVSAGVVLLELIAENFELIEVFTVNNKKKKELRIRPASVDYIEALNDLSAGRMPLYMPFVEEPLDWIDPLSGGFHTLNVYSTALVKTSDRDYLTALTDADMPDVYTSINMLQRTPWKINTPIWEMFDYLWTESLPATGLPIREDLPIPPRPANIDTDKEARQEWRKKSRAIHDSNHRRGSERLAASRLHWICKQFLDRKFWFCHQVDWRGRAYPVTYYLSPQGSDYVKSLLTFASGAPVESVAAKRAHAVHGANMFGLDKMTFEERFTWVKDHEAWLRKIAEDPLDCRDWEAAGSPWQFLAWAIDHVAILDNPLHPSTLPIQQDATQSGIQIYSLLLRDSEGARATNVTPSDTPQDLYGLVASDLEKRLAAAAQAPGPNQRLAKAWLDFGIDRKCCKRPVMTRVYNATRHSSSKYVQEWAEDKEQATGKPHPRKENADEKPYWFLTELLWDAMESVVSSTTRGQDWFSEVATCFADNSLPIQWTNPLGLPVKQWYSDHNHYCVRTRIGEKFRQVGLRAATGKVDRRKMRSAFAPNFIHSLDAAAMMRTMVLAKDLGVRHVACNHDSFASIAADSPALAEATRKSFCELFSKDVLANLREELVRQLPYDTALPDLPSYGDLDVSLVLKSPYFFS